MKRLACVGLLTTAVSINALADTDSTHLTLTVVPGSEPVGDQVDYATTVDKRRYTEVVRVESSDVEATTALLEQRKEVRDVSESRVVSNPDPVDGALEVRALSFTEDPLFNDPGFADQYFWVEGTETSALEGNPEGSSVQKAVKASETAEKVTVAVVDGGFHEMASFEWAHGFNLISPDNDPDGILPFGADFINSGFDDCDNGHGQQVASVIGGRQDDGLGNAGVVDNNDDADFYGVRVLNCNNSGLLSVAAEGIRYAAGDDSLTHPDTNEAIPPVDETANIINLSLGSSTEESCPTFMQDAVDFARNQGAIIVIAAGNTGTDESLPPGNCDGVINVGAMNERGQPAGFSTYGSELDYSAAGSSVPVEDENGLSFSSGTSFSAPLVSGILANLWKDVPGLTAQQVRQFSLESTNNPPTLDQDMGEGILDAVKLQETAIEALNPPDVQVDHPLGGECGTNEKLAFFTNRDASNCDLREVAINSEVAEGRHVVVFESDGEFTTDGETVQVHQASQKRRFIIDQWDPSSDYSVQICDEADGTGCDSAVLTHLNLDGLELGCGDV